MFWAFLKPIDSFLKGATVNDMTISLKLGNNELLFLALHGAN